MKAYICDWCGAVTPKPKIYRFYEFCDDGDTPKIHIGKHRKKVHMCGYCYDYLKQIVINKSRKKHGLKSIK